MVIRCHVVVFRALFKKKKKEVFVRVKYYIIVHVCVWAAVTVSYRRIGINHSHLQSLYTFQVLNMSGLILKKSYGDSMRNSIQAIILMEDASSHYGVFKTIIMHKLQSSPGMQYDIFCHACIPNVYFSMLSDAAVSLFSIRPAGGKHNFSLQDARYV